VGEKDHVAKGTAKERAKVRREGWTDKAETRREREYHERWRTSSTRTGEGRRGGGGGWWSGTKASPQQV